MPITAEARERLTADAAEIVARYPQPRSALLPLLHLVQSEEGHVSPDGVAFCAEVLDLTTAEVSAVATFYSQFKRRPNGTYTIGVCRNTLCAIMGGDEIYASLAEHLGIVDGQTTTDGMITLERVECNAACDYAPVVMANWEFFDNQTPASARELVDSLRAGEDVAPTRGAAKVCTFKEVSRVLAGFHDGRAGEGLSAGEPTLRGLRPAREQGWDGGPVRTEPAGVGAAAAGEPTPRGGVTSAHDAPPVPARTRRRAGTTAGRPAAQATTGEDAPGSASAADGTEEA